jgi:hypothetical protein
MSGSRSVPASPNSSSATFGRRADPSEASDKHAASGQLNGHSTNTAAVNGNRSSLRKPRSPKLPQANGQEGDDAAWGSNFWVTLVDPQVSNASDVCSKVFDRDGFRHKWHSLLAQQLAK